MGRDGELGRQEAADAAVPSRSDSVAGDEKRCDATGVEQTEEHPGAASTPVEDPTDPTADLTGTPAEQLAVLLNGSRRAENLETFRQLRVIEAWWRGWLPDDATIRADRRARRTHTSEESLHHASVVTEVAGAMTLTEHSAARRVDAALALLVDDRLPLAAATAAEGLLDWPRLNILVSRTHTLTKAQARAVEERVLVPGGLKLTYGLFERAVDRAVLAVDPDAAEERRAEAARSRRVTFIRNRNGCGGLDGAATLWATGPADALLAAFAAVDAAARWLRRNGDPRTLDQLRHDLLVDGCTRGSLPVPQDVLPVRPDWAAAARARSSREAVAYEIPPGSPVLTTTARRPVVATHITVTVSEDTLAGRNDEPADLAGYGPITAQMARDLARNGIWRCAAVDAEHATVVGVGRTTWTPGYVPGKALRDFLVVAALSCTVPWCSTVAEHCDIDHATPYAAGGATCSCNTNPLCRRHHREKSAGYLTTEPSTDPAHPLGTTIWTTRAGQTFVVLPYSPLPPEAYRAADATALAALAEDDLEDEHDPTHGGDAARRYDPILGLFTTHAPTAAHDEPGRAPAPDHAPPF